MLKYQEIVLFTFLTLTAFISSKTAFGCEDEPVKQVERLLDIIAGRLLAEGLNSVTLFHRQAIDSLKYSRILINKYSPEDYKQALKEGRTAGSDSNSAAILDQIGLYRNIVECSNQNLIDFLDQLLRANEKETCKIAVATIEKLLGTLENGEKDYHWLNVLRVMMTQQCEEAQ